MELIELNGPLSPRQAGRAAIRRQTEREREQRSTRRQESRDVLVILGSGWNLRQQQQLGARPSHVAQCRLLNCLPLTSGIPNDTLPDDTWLQI